MNINLTLHDLNELKEMKIEIEYIDLKSILLSQESDLRYAKGKPVSFECNQEYRCYDNTVTRQELITELKANQVFNDIKDEQFQDNWHNVDQPLKELHVVLLREHLEEKKSLMTFKRYVNLFVILEYFLKL